MTDQELEQWVKEKQIILDRLLEEQSPEYVPTRLAFAEEYKRLKGEDLA